MPVELSCLSIATSSNCPEESLAYCISSMLKAYIAELHCGECRQDSCDLCREVASWDEGAAEHKLQQTLHYLTGTMLPDANGDRVSRVLGVLRRAELLLGTQYWGNEGLRFSRALGVLQCVKDGYRQTSN